MAGVFQDNPTFLKPSLQSAKAMPVDTTQPPVLQHSIQELKNRASSSDDHVPSRNSDEKNKNTRDRETSSSSLHSYHMWLKEKQKEEEEKKSASQLSPAPTSPTNNVKEEADDDDSNEDSYQVDAIMERGPSPPENENSNSYEWSYEEQFKQLYEIDEDPERKLFLDEYFEFMKGRGTPVSRIPIMAKQILDLFQLYNLVVKHGGLVQVIRNKLWSKITKGLNLPTSITSAAFTLRTQYLKYLYPYECTMHNFSTPKELQAAIDSNRRDRFSTLYHAEPTMTSSRDDRFGTFPHNGCDYPQPRHHMAHMGLTPPQDIRYGLKRPGEPIYSKYSKYGVDNPKVIVLQDGTPSMEHHVSKTSPPSSYYTRTRSPPSRESEMRSKIDIEATRLRGGHHFGGYGSKDWESETRHVIEEERRRLMEDRSSRNGSGPVCKDKNCNGIDCKYMRPEIHRHRSHDPMMNACSCSYCKDYRVYSPTRQEAKHHMDGASSSNGRLNGSHTPPSRGCINGGSPPPQQGILLKNCEDETDNGKMTTFKMKLPDLRKGGNKIQISLEVGGVVYEGVICSTTPLLNGDHTPDKEKEEINGH